MISCPWYLLFKRPKHKIATTVCYKGAKGLVPAFKLEEGENLSEVGTSLLFYGDNTLFISFAPFSKWLKSRNWVSPKLQSICGPKFVCYAECMGNVHLKDAHCAWITHILVTKYGLNQKTHLMSHSKAKMRWIIEKRMFIQTVSFYKSQLFKMTTVAGVFWQTFSNSPRNIFNTSHWRFIPLRFP